MQKSLFEYVSSNEKVNKVNTQEEKKSTKVNEKHVKEKINDYSKLSQNELMMELFREVDNMKKSGNFNLNELSKQLDNVKPMLTPQQIETLENLLNRIK